MGKNYYTIDNKQVICFNIISLKLFSYTDMVEKY